MTTSPFVTRSAAMQQPTHHQFIPRIGYLAHAGAPELPEGRELGTKNCAPPEGTKDGSRHVLQPPYGHPTIEMLWVAADGAWMHPVPGKGNRIAWTTDHLMKAGWEYVGPVKAKAKRA